LAPGQRPPWPWALAREPGEPVDLRVIPGPEVQSHDEVYLTDLDQGAVVVTNPRLGLAFHLTWDARVFGCLVMWQPFGGVDVWPWADSYGVGVEPWTTPSNLAGALAAGQALRLDPDEALTTALRIKIIEVGGESSGGPTTA